MNLFGSNYAIWIIIIAIILLFVLGSDTDNCCGCSTCESNCGSCPCGCN